MKICSVLCSGVVDLCSGQLFGDGSFALVFAEVAI